MRKKVLINTKVERLLDAMAIVLKDENLKLIEKMHEVINDKKDGYQYDFISACASNRTWIHGKSY